MAKITLRFKSKKSKKDDDPPVKQEITSPTLKIKTSKQSTSLPKIKLKTSSDSSETPSISTIKFKPLDTKATAAVTQEKFTTNNPVKVKRTPTIKVKPAKLPGNGYDSEDPDKEEDPLIEEALVLRFLPDETLDTVRAAVESAERGDKYNSSNADGRRSTDLSSISITWNDKRRAIVRINDVMYAAKLVNLPTVSEVHKTIDRKNIFKTLDVSQMLLVVKRIYSEKEILDIKVDKEYGETFPDGLTPPMEFAKQRFDKKYEASVIQNVEDEVARLLKLDAEAESSIFEFIDADEEDFVPMSVIEGKIKNKRAKKEKKRLKKERDNLQKEKETMASTEEEANVDNQFEDIDNELDRLMKEEDDDNDDDDDEDEDEDDEEEEDEVEEEEEGLETSNTFTETANKRESESEDDDDDDDDEEDDDDDDDDDDIAVNGAVRTGNNEVDEFTQHNALLAEEITELELTIDQKQKDLKKAMNPIMKNRITDVISRLQQELNIKKSQSAAEEEKRKAYSPKSSDTQEGVEGVNGGAEEGEDEDEDGEKDGEGNDGNTPLNEHNDEAESQGDEEDNEEAEDENDYDDLF